MKKTRLMIFGLAILSLSLTALLFTSSKAEVVSGTLLANMEAIAYSDFCDEAYGPCGSGGNGAYQHSCYSPHNNPGIDCYGVTWGDPNFHWCMNTIVTWGFSCQDCITLVFATDNKYVCRFQ